ncbi:MULTISPECIES: winged helix-turn-helix domain-containing protein [unclassified Vibrio]|uniref:winged helix-turn-helix domain-containing protein n=1 Tax=unclassified Vibrio TaxID=2614977 RepID=UPI000B8EAFFC|nr:MULTISPECIES: winged helix-turn-helix domain-containing protein [unclassified Vibrio]OXX36161.1 hypothetical protein B9J95_01090 [Vibrio sp. V14_P6S14T42]OXX39253.1 hypothetical protein B9J81_00155 [Vibrio sp. V04_P4A5T148]OXX57391.1 hypothetical protein B9J91_05460 [Vibrio sp. V18_P1S4T112]
MKLYLDTETNQILDQAGQGVKKLSEAESNILAEFIQKRGKCLSREQLMQAGWPKQHVVENALNMAIRKLRAVGLSIETIARKGYALVDDSITLACKESLVLQQQENHASQPNLERTIEETLEENAKQGNELAENHENDISLSLSQQYILHQSRRTKAPQANGKMATSMIFLYLLMLAIFYFMLEGAKPNIRCFESEAVKVCTTYSAFDENLIETLSPGIYIYGKTYDESGTRKFIKIKN